MLLSFILAQHSWNGHFQRTRSGVLTIVERSYFAVTSDELGNMLFSTTDERGGAYGAHNLSLFSSSFHFVHLFSQSFVFLTFST